jgi:hypothetical protein
VLTGQTRLGETYATTDRDLRFRFTVRDNNGGVNQQDLVITVTTANQTFNIDTPTQWQGLSKQTVTWDIGDTLKAPINCANVDILLIADAVNPIETKVLMGTPNDGQQNITVPNVTSVNARLVLKCSDNIFYALSPAAFSIMTTETVAPKIDSQKTISLSEDTTTQIEFADLNVFDPDSAYPEDFTLSLQNGDNYSINQQTLTPNMDFNGMLSVSVVVNDGTLDSNVFSLQVQVRAVNDAPVANNDNISVEQNSGSVAIDVLINDNDVDRDMLSIDSFSYSGQGQVTISNQQLRYTPASDFSGMESIFYVVSDGTLTDDGTLSIQVNSVMAASNDSGGGSMMLLSLLSFLCFSVKFVNHSLFKGDDE